MNGPRLTSGGKPEVLYVGTEYCPYCDAESWPLIVALSRFGEFTGLRTSRSPLFEGIPPTDGWTFYGSSYTGRYLAFAPVETYSNVLVKPKADPGNPKTIARCSDSRPPSRLSSSEFDRAGNPVPRFRRHRHPLGSGVLPDAGRTDLEPDRRRSAAPGDHGGRRHPLGGQHPDVRTLPAHRRPPGRRLPGNHIVQLERPRGSAFPVPSPPRRAVGADPVFPAGRGAAPVRGAGALSTSGPSAADGASWQLSERPLSDLQREAAPCPRSVSKCSTARPSGVSAR